MPTMKRKRSIENCNQTRFNDSEIATIINVNVNHNYKQSRLTYFAKRGRNLNPMLSIARNQDSFHGISYNDINVLDRLLDLVHFGLSSCAIEALNDTIVLLLAKETSRREKSNISSMNLTINETQDTMPLLLTEKLASSFFRLLSISAPKQDRNQDDRIFQAVYLFTTSFPFLRFHVSSTGNTPLHLALLYNGHSEKLIKLLLECSDSKKIASILTRKNRSGKLPIHVALNSGVSMDVLQLIISASIKAFTINDNYNSNPNPSANIVQIEDGRGMNAIELAWVRRLDPNFRSFKGRKVNQIYRSLLSEAVDQVESEYKSHLSAYSSKTSTKSSILRSKERESVANDILGSFWQSTLLLLRGARHGTISDPLPSGVQWRIVHAASALWSCPIEVLKIALLLYPEQIFEKDENGMLPLHLALSCNTNEIPSSRLQHYYEKVELIFNFYPKAAKIKSEKGQLPLHLILTHKMLNVIEKQFWEKLAKKITRTYPEALDVMDPVFNLYPYMQAAVAVSDHESEQQQKSNISLDMIYELLRMSPTRTQITIPR